MAEIVELGPGRHKVPVEVGLEPKIWSGGCQPRVSRLGLNPVLSLPWHLDSPFWGLLTSLQNGVTNHTRFITLLETVQ